MNILDRLMRFITHNEYESVDYFNYCVGEVVHDAFMAGESYPALEKVLPYYCRAEVLAMLDNGIYKLRLRLAGNRDDIPF